MDIAEKRQLDCKALLEGALKGKEIVSDKGKLVKAFAVGKSKTYFRSGALEYLESCRRNGLDGPATTIQKAARGWLARNAGKHTRQLRKMEEEQRARARQTEAEQQLKLAREAAERRTERKRGLQDLKDQIAMLEKKCAKHDRKQQRKVQKALERNKQSRRELEEMKQHFAACEEVAMRQGTIDQVEQQYLIEEHGKLIAYLRNENARARKENAHIQSKLDFELTKQKFGEDMHETLAYRLEMAQRAHKAGELVKSALEETKAKCKKLDVKVTHMQSVYIGEAKARLQLQKSVASILTMVQERVRDRNLVEETIITALRAEACSKSQMAALDVAALEPDLTGSDVSLGDSCTSFTESF
jgi:myosin heavy subunit